jgi:hypothetical protein
MTRREAGRGASVVRAESDGWMAKLPRRAALEVRDPARCCVVPAPMRGCVHQQLGGSCQLTLLLAFLLTGKAAAEGLYGADSPVTSFTTAAQVPHDDPTAFVLLEFCACKRAESFIPGSRVAGLTVADAPLRVRQTPRGAATASTLRRSMSRSRSPRRRASRD